MYFSYIYIYIINVFLFEKSEGYIFELFVQPIYYLLHHLFKVLILNLTLE